MLAVNMLLVQSLLDVAKISVAAAAQQFGVEPTAINYLSSLTQVQLMQLCSTQMLFSPRMSVESMEQLLRCTTVQDRQILADLL